MTQAGGMGSHQSPVPTKTEWITPQAILNSLGVFDLDPCAAVGQPWPTARAMIRLPDDGLRAAFFGRVWLNPPWGREQTPWLKKMADHASGIALLPARTDRADWHQYIFPRATGILFMMGRPTFHHITGEAAPFNCGCPTALIAYTLRDLEWLDRSNIPGRIVALHNQPKTIR